jgi:hypothetical protein
MADGPRLGLKPKTETGPDELELMFRMTARTVEGTQLEARLDRPSGKVHIVNRSTGNVVHAFGVNEVKP